MVSRSATRTAVEPRGLEPGARRPRTASSSSDTWRSHSLNALYGKAVKPLTGHNRSTKLRSYLFDALGALDAPHFHIYDWGKFVTIRSSLICGAVLATISCSTSYEAETQSDVSYSYAYVKIDETSQPTRIETDLTNLARSPEGRAVATAVGAYFGIDPQSVNTAITAAAIMHDSVVKKTGEERLGRLSFGSELSVCRVLKAGVVSRTCGSALGSDIGGVDGHQMTYYVHAPINNSLGGRCWVEADFVVLLVPKSEKSEADCSPNNARVIDCGSNEQCTLGPGVKQL
jgi:hypothetical protein